jgi:Ca2+-binding EF-hand superfamily protein
MFFTEEQIKKLRTEFKNYDKDNDGKISVDEIISVLREEERKNLIKKS